MFVCEEGNFENGETGGEPLGQGREQQQQKNNLHKDLDQKDLGPGFGPAQAPLDGWGLGLGALTIEPQLYLQVRKLIGNISYR